MFRNIYKILKWNKDNLGKHKKQILDKLIY